MKSNEKVVKGNFKQHNLRTEDDTGAAVPEWQVSRADRLEDAIVLVVIAVIIGLGALAIIVCTNGLRAY